MYMYVHVCTCMYIHKTVITVEDDVNYGLFNLKITHFNVYIQTQCTIVIDTHNAMYMYTMYIHMYVHTCVCTLYIHVHMYMYIHQYIIYSSYIVHVHVYSLLNTHTDVQSLQYIDCYYYYFCYIIT